MSVTKLFNRSALTVGTIGLVGATAFLGANPAQAAGFSDQYAPSNWTFKNSNANGAFSTSNAPKSIFLIGGNTQSGSGGSTTYTTTAAATGLVSFYWSYLTSDLGSFFDPFGFILNGTFTQLTGYNLFGTYSTLVNAGDTFGFAVNTRNNLGGRGNVMVSNFTAPSVAPTPVPEPASVLGLLALGALGVSGKLKRNMKQNAGDNNLN